MTYDRTVAAALAETKSKFALAEALARDIPPRRRGPSNDAEITQYLTEARQAIIDAGGEPRALTTLSQYRNTALWVSAGSATNFRWIKDVAYSTHSQARGNGLSYEEFAANPVTENELRGRSYSPDGPPERAIQSWTPAQKASAAQELLADPEVAEQALNTPQARQPGSAASKAVGNVARATENRRMEEAHRTERKANDDPVSRRNSQAQAVLDLEEACDRFARDAARSLQGVGELPEGRGRFLAEAADRAGATLAAIRDYIDTGKTGVDAELAKLLESGT